MLKEQMVFGCVDMISHIFEIYFSHPDESNVSDDICEALMKNIIENLEVALVNPLDYNARSNLMWDSTMALNGITRLGKEQDWMSHQIEYALSAFFDISHGAGLAIVHPIYLKYIYKNALKKFVRYAKNIWNVDPTSKTDDMIVLEGIEKTRAYFKRIGAPITLTEVGIKESAIEGIVEKIRLYKTSYSLLTKLDLNIILHNCL
jgi:alcohol dehydrogenase YqhD (iron-dependent ADH family)